MTATQLELDLTSEAPINTDKLSGQNKRLYEYLLSGKSIHCFSEARRILRIGYLNSRASDLINLFGIDVKKRRIKVRDVEGNLTTVVEYSL